MCTFQSLQGLILTIDALSDIPTLLTFQSLQGLILTLQKLQRRNHRIYVSIPPRSDFNTVAGLFARGVPVLVSIPPRSDFNAIVFLCICLCLPFQSLQGLILTNRAGRGDDIHKYVSIPPRSDFNQI